ncbi:MAG: tRNA lysidine(34) synthetase TilS, partial [Chloroflexia bacterium]
HSYPKRLYYDQVSVMECSVRDAAGSRQPAVGSREKVAAEYREEAGELVGVFDWDALEAVGPVVVRTRREGDFIRPMGMRGRKSLQDLMVDAKIAAWVRDHIPVIAFAEGAGEILWVPGKGGRRSSRAPVGPETRRTLVITFSRREG